MADNTTKASENTSSIASYFQHLVADLKEGFSYIGHSKWLWASLLVVAIVNTGQEGSIEVALPKLIHDVYKSGVWLLGVIFTAYAVGAIAALVTSLDARAAAAAILARERRFNCNDGDALNLSIEGESRQEAAPRGVTDAFRELPIFKGIPVHPCHEWTWLSGRSSVTILVCLS